MTIAQFHETLCVIPNLRFGQDGFVPASVCALLHVREPVLVSLAAAEHELLALAFFCIVVKPLEATPARPRLHRLRAHVQRLRLGREAGEGALFRALKAVLVAETAAVSEFLALMLLPVKVPHRQEASARPGRLGQIASPGPGRLHALIPAGVRVVVSVFVAAAASRPPESRAAAVRFVVEPLLSKVLLARPGVLFHVTDFAWNIAATGKIEI